MARHLHLTTKDQPNYITPSGLQQIQEEYQRLKHVERPEIVETVSWAASLGDRSENGDYIYGKKRLREIDSRLRYLGERLDKVELIDPTKKSSDKVEFGATVDVIDEDGNKKTYKIVGVDETDAEVGKVSWLSPIGKALLNSKVDDFVNFKTPKGDRELEIVSIRYEFIS